ncbi:MAG: SDR family NAD(P)-dependent oxidoreductase [Ruminococcus sp.]|nr:SDR family NAD(P)-dependent oxidoreductase [Ruminococcus sp.]
MKVCVITGGGSGMGLGAARAMPNDRIFLLSGRTQQKLDKAAKQLKAEGRQVYIKTCDTSDKKQVHELARYAASLGEVTNVINAAGLSPSMADPEKLLRVNAFGTVYVNREFAKVMKKGVIVDISSNSAYQLPKMLIPEKTYRLAEKQEQEFLKRLLRMCGLIKDDYKRSGLAYALSKNFVLWYAKKSAFELGDRGIRVCSLSPGLVATDMGELEKGEGASMLKHTAEKRMGTPQELGFAIAMVADERNGYLAGVDVLVDGGSVSGKRS